METNFSPTVIVMIRALRLGYGKRRIAQEVGDVLALEINSQLTRRQIASLPAPETCVLCFAPDNAEAELRQEFGSGFRYVAQGEDCLGERLSRISRAECERNPSGVILIGIDCPELTSQMLIEAKEKLRNSDAVLGPAADGGYYLLGFRKWHPTLFQGVDWGTDRVLEQTEDRLKLLGLSWNPLAVLHDVDTWEDALEARRREWIHF